MRLLAATSLFALLSISSVLADDLDAAQQLDKRQNSTSSSDTDTSITPTASPSAGSTSLVEDNASQSVETPTHHLTSTSGEPSSSVTSLSSTTTESTTTSTSSSTFVSPTKLAPSVSPKTVVTVQSTFGSHTITQAITTGSFVRVPPTGVAGVNGESSGSGSSGLSSSSKSIIGGVVGGVGGAILLGALAYTAWRLWGKKQHDTDENDLYDPNAKEKASNSANNNTPFRSNLDQYHAPAPTNTASNF